MVESKDKKLVILAKAIVEDTIGLTFEEIVSYQQVGAMPTRYCEVMLNIEDCTILPYSDKKYTVVLCHGQRMLVQESYQVLKAAKDSISIVINLTDILK